MTARFTVIAAGQLTSLQGSPRKGARRFGVPPSGAIDDLAYRAANTALGNAEDAPAIEVSLGGLTLRCDEGEAAFALTGGDFSGKSEGSGIPPWSLGHIAAGETLHIRPGKTGNWGIIAFAGGLQSPQWLGSASTHAQSGLGGGLLKEGMSFTANSDVGLRPIGPFAAPQQRTGVLDLILGPQDHCFDQNGIEAFLDAPITATSAFDRMGMRISGAIPHPKDLSILSEPAVRGAIQIDGSGRAVVLLNDHQTTGGYPKIGVIASYDVARLAQARAGESFRLNPITPAESIVRVRAARKAESDYLAALAAGPLDLESQLRSANLISGITDGDAV